MRINVLQHAPNEGPGAIKEWADRRDADFYVYHPEKFSRLPRAAETDFLVILGGPMSPNDHLVWIKQERKLIKALLQAGKPLLGVCFGAQQIAMTLGGKVVRAPHKEVGWAPIYRQKAIMPFLPKQMTVLHWHQDMFTLPAHAKLLYRSDLVQNQAFLWGKNVVGLQFHLEPEEDNLREIAINDCHYAETNNDLRQTAMDIMAHGVPHANKQIMFNLLNYLVKS